MDYYDTEAPVYDESRGGTDRARAAAEAVARIAPPPGTLLDLGGGTGIVSAELAALGYDVLLADRSAGMLDLGGRRLPGRVLRSTADRLPLRDACVDVVACIWLLHLLPVEVVDAVVAEAARVLRPGGLLVTTVDKSLAHGTDRRPEADHRPRLDAVAGECALRPAGGTTFSGRSRWGSATGGDPVFTVVGYRRG